MKLKILFILFLFSSLGHSQLGDIAKIDYTILPGGDSDVEYNRIRGLFNYPIKLKKKDSYLFLGLDYSNINLIMDDNPSFDKTEISDFRLLDFNVAYTALLKNDWRLGVQFTPGFSSNLTSSDIKLDDVILSGAVVFIKDKKESDTVKKPWRLILGASYSENRGFSFPLPFVVYYRKFHKKWSYSVGIPKTNLQYHASNAHRFKLYFEIDGFTANLQRGLLIDNTEVAQSINMSLLLGGLQYEYHFAKHIEFYARASNIISNSVNLRDLDKDNIKALDNTNQLYLRAGIRLKI